MPETLRRGSARTIKPTWQWLMDRLEEDKMNQLELEKLLKQLETRLALIEAKLISQKPPATQTDEKLPRTCQLEESDEDGVLDV